MKKVIIQDKRQAALIDVPIPKPKDDWALIKVHASALCTEYKSFLVGRALSQGGHEGVGEVFELSQPGPVKVGDRVVILPQYSCGECSQCTTGNEIFCENNLDFTAIFGNNNGRGAFAQYLLAPTWRLRIIPDDVPYEHATMAIDGIGATFGAFQMLEINATDTLLITGLGPVGLGGVVNARFRGTRVIGVEPSPWRRDRAFQMGAEAVFNPDDSEIMQKIKDITDGKGFSCAMDCSGAVAAQRLCIDAISRRGRVAFVGESNEDLTIKASPDFIRKGLTLVGSWLYNTNDYPKVMQVIQQSPLINLLVSHSLPMSQMQKAFELMVSGECAKVVVNPWK